MILSIDTIWLNNPKFQPLIRATMRGFEPMTFGSEVQHANPLRYTVSQYLIIWEDKKKRELDPNSSFCYCRYIICSTKNERNLMNEILNFVGNTYKQTINYTSPRNRLLLLFKILYLEVELLIKYIICLMNPKVQPSILTTMRSFKPITLGSKVQRWNPVPYMVTLYFRDRERIPKTHEILIRTLPR